MQNFNGLNLDICSNPQKPDLFLNVSGTSTSRKSTAKSAKEKLTLEIFVTTVGREE